MLVRIIFDTSPPSPLSFSWLYQLARKTNIAVLIPQRSPLFLYNCKDPKFGPITACSLARVVNTLASLTPETRELSQDQRSVLTPETERINLGTTTPVYTSYLLKRLITLFNPPSYSHLASTYISKTYLHVISNFTDKSPSGK